MLNVSAKLIQFVNYCKLWTLMVSEILWFDIFDRIRLVQPIRLLNHSYKDPDMPIGACFMRV